jgi:hypothetical protein
MLTYPRLGEKIIFPKLSRGGNDYDKEKHRVVSV